MTLSLSRRNFLRSAALGAAGAAAPGFPARWFAGEPARAPEAGGPILLNSNENAYGPLPSTQAVMRQALGFAHRYPDKEFDHLVERIAAYHGVEPHRVLAGCGSTEILRIAAEAFLGRGTKKLVTAAPTFEAMAWYARAFAAPVTALALTKDYAHDLERMRAAAAPSGGLVYICNPNNPTASLTPRREIEQFIAGLPGGVCVLIDEAYHHFAVGAPEYTSFLEKPVADPRVIVARTFSKVYGMAGLRLGYAVGQPETIQKMRPFQLQDHINMVAALSGVAALDDDAGMRAAVERNARDRDEFMRQAAARGVRAIPSYCNFVMIESGRPAKQVIAHFERNRILIGRRFPPLATWTRISLGTPPEMQAFWRVWDTLPPSPHAGTAGS